MSTSDAPRGGEVAWRLDEQNRRLEKVEKAVEPLPVIDERVKALTEGMESIKRVLWTIAGGLVLLVMSVLFAAAQFGA
jgi:hypothetical protein